MAKISTHYTIIETKIAGMIVEHNLAVDYRTLPAYPAIYEVGSVLPVSPAEAEVIEIIAVRIELTEGEWTGFAGYLRESQEDALRDEIRAEE